jgi:hypothetical protein
MNLPVAITVKVNESEGNRRFELSLAVTYHILGRTCCFFRVNSVTLNTGAADFSEKMGLTY